MSKLYYCSIIIILSAMFVGFMMPPTTKMTTQSERTYTVEEMLAEFGPVITKLNIYDVYLLAEFLNRVQASHSLSVKAFIEIIYLDRETDVPKLLNTLGQTTTPGLVQVYVQSYLNTCRALNHDRYSAIYQKAVISQRVYHLLAKLK